MKIAKRKIKKIMAGMTGLEKNQRLAREVSCRRLDHARMLLDLGADVNYRDSSGWSVLHTAACNGDAAMVQTLLKFGADPESKNENGWSPIYMAVREGFSDVVSILLNAGANANMQDMDGWTLLHAAAYNGDTDMMMELVRAGGDPTLKNKMGISAIETLENLYPEKYEGGSQKIIGLYLNISSLRREDATGDDAQVVDFNI